MLAVLLTGAFDVDSGAWLRLPSALSSDEPAQVPEYSFTAYVLWACLATCQAPQGTRVTAQPLSSHLSGLCPDDILHYQEAPSPVTQAGFAQCWA